MMDDLEDIITAIENRIDNYPFLIAIDGRCASGKTTLATQLMNRWNCNVIHADDFFLRPEQRTERRIETPGENIDHERLLREVILPLKEGKMFSYRPYDCHTKMLKAPVLVNPTDITIIEGSYSCHPYLWDYYDLHIFLNINKKNQIQRIKNRDPEKEEVFLNKWIPLEEKYFSHFEIEERCELTFE